MKINYFLIILTFGFTVLAQQPGAGVTDIDGNSYQTIVIGSQEWMQSNLKTERFRNADLIPTTPFFTYDYSAEPQPLYQWLSLENLNLGRHYTWFAVIDERGLCPIGWRVPSANDWEELITNLGGFLVAGGKMKETGFSSWLAPNEGATNESNFNGVAAGYHHMYGGDYGINYNAFFTSSTEYSTDANWIMYLSWMSGSLYTNGMSPTKNLGLSCRCIKESNLGIDSHESSLQIYPNPITGNVLHIEIPGNPSKQIEIFNTLGQQVLKETLDGDVLDVNLSAGVYLIKIIHDEQVYVRKVVVK
ncbi:MAG TPA: FISUMP domain-containing protein [Flavobacterium sp.]|jgi:uncharacterized protein (TIGR02145 family)